MTSSPTRADRPALAGLVLAAGAGTRLQPLSTLRPKPLCPVANVALLDLALARVFDALHRVARPGAPAPAPEPMAVNLCHGRHAIEAHLAASPWHRSVHRSVEPLALGTAGAVAPLRDWLDGRGLLIVNGDTWCPAPLTALLDAWDGERVAVAVAGDPPLHARSSIVASILPWSDVCAVAPRPAGLWERFWRDRLAQGELLSVGISGPFVDCATPRDYLRANLEALAFAGRGAAAPGSGSLIDPTAEVAPSAVVAQSVIGADAFVAGRLTRSVVWPNAVVAEHEVLVDCIRTDAGTTVSAAPAAG